jgi:hypothetical protein
MGEEYSRYQVVQIKKERELVRFESVLKLQQRRQIFIARFWNTSILELLKIAQKGQYQFGNISWRHSV